MSIILINKFATLEERSNVQRAMGSICITHSTPAHAGSLQLCVVGIGSGRVICKRFVVIATKNEIRIDICSFGNGIAERRDCTVVSAFHLDDVHARLIRITAIDGSLTAAACDATAQRQIVAVGIKGTTAVANVFNFDMVGANRQSIESTTI